MVEAPERPLPEPPAPAPVRPAPAPQPPAGGLSLVDVRRLWPDIVEATKLRHRLTWIHLTQHAQVVAVDATTLTLGFSNAGARESFTKGGSPDIVRQAAIDVVGADWKIEAIVDPGAQVAAAPAPSDSDDPWAGAPGPAAPDDEPAPASQAAPPRPPRPQPPREVDPAGIEAAREAIQETRPGGTERGPDQDLAAADAEADRDDPDAETSGLTGAALLQQALGAEVIEEIPHQ